MVLWNLDIHMPKKKSKRKRNQTPSLHLFWISKEIHSTLNKDLITRPETVKVLEKNIGENLLDISHIAIRLTDISHSNDFLDIAPKAQATKEK